MNKRTEIKYSELSDFFFLEKGTFFNFQNFRNFKKGRFRAFLWKNSMQLFSEPIFFQKKNRLPEDFSRQLYTKCKIFRPMLIVQLRCSLWSNGTTE